MIGPDERRLAADVGTAIDFLTPARGFMATRGGRLRRTDDAGRTWKVVASGVHLVSLSFVSASQGFALTEHGGVAATRDGGRSWRILHSFGTRHESGPFPGAIQFVDPERGWVSPFDDRIYRTLDGGRSWERLPIPCDFALGGFGFVDANTGFLICGGQPATIQQEKDLYATADGGDTWTLRACVHFFGRRCRTNLPGSGYASGLDFRDPRVGLLVTDRGGLARTGDGGERWASTLFTDDAYSVVSTSWASARTVYALIFQNGSLLRSDDAGRHWRQVYPLGPGPPTETMSFSSPTRGIGAGTVGVFARAGTIVSTEDGGSTWRRRGAVDKAGVSQFVRLSPRVVWALATRDLPDGGYRWLLFRTSDDGRHWERRPAPPGLDRATLTFPTQRVGYLADASKRLFETTDGGASWRLVRKGRNLRGASFFSPRDGLLAGYDVGLLRTTDGGRTWKQVKVVPPLKFLALDVLDARHWWLEGYTCPNAGKTIGPKEFGFAKPAPCGGENRILRTADGGRSWTAIRLGRLPGADFFTFVTPEVGYAGNGERDGFYRTADGGRTWRFVYAS